MDKHLSQQTWESFVNHYVAAGMLLGATLVCVLYPIIHSIYLRFSSIYRKTLTPQQQTTVVQHTIEAIVLWLLFFPLSWIVFSLFFEEQPIDEFQKKFNAMAVMGFVLIIMYLMVSANILRRTNNELWSTALLTPLTIIFIIDATCFHDVRQEIAARYQSLRPLVVVHHLVALLDCVFPVIFMTTENIKAACLLNYFITYEALIFVGLVLYRLQPTHPWTPRVILAGMIMFGLSRPLQLVWIVTTLAVSWSDLNVGYALFQLVLTTLFTFLQLYSLSIHRILYKNVVAEQARQKISLFVDESTSTKKTLPISAHGDLDEATLNNKADYERTATFDDDADESSMQV